MQSLYKLAPEEVGGFKEKLWNDDVNFFFNSGRIIDNLEGRGANYFHKQLELMGSRHKHARAGDRNIAVALNTAKRMAPDLQEIVVEES